ncbi:MAG TPA: polysaccharide pyruvyl transferase family protein [Actinomycetota bacterium]|jgi:polysaccharide pyruvyl transferase WcaK-like protein|nr:polysaccharide pyruvyl transferase family protein [Actinomycetota bacterium]
MAPLKILLIGYSGANNTGAEALLQADIEDLRAVFGEEALLTIPALKDPANLRRYLHEGPALRIVSMPSVFPVATRRLVREHDLVVLVEGSAYMDTWTSALLWYFLWATRCAYREGKPCLAYAVDAGQLRPRNQRLVRRWASTTDLIVTRSRAAAERLRGWGVTAPIEWSADNAFNFDPRPEDEEWAHAIWPGDPRPPIGIAAVDFFRWPVVIRPWGRSEDRYRWPYFFSTSPARRRRSTDLAASYACLADRVIERHDRSVALVCMEELDEPVARAIHHEMEHPERAKVFSSREQDASRMTALLQSLGVLVTSRYHASVLSLAAGVPQVAVGHDLRLRTLYEELGLEPTHFFAPDDDPAVFARVAETVEALLLDPGGVRDALHAGYEAHVSAARRNRELLRGFAAAHGWGVPAWAT